MGENKTGVTLSRGVSSFGPTGFTVARKKVREGQVSNVNLNVGLQRGQSGAGLDWRRTPRW